MLKSSLLIWVLILLIVPILHAQNPAPGIEHTARYFPLLSGKKIGLVVHQASRFENSSLKTHLVDSLLHSGMKISKIFAPEHGFKGTADAGEYITDGSYQNIPVISLYGKNKKPSLEQMQGLDFMIFDLQDVGARFYTYLSTLHYVLQTCAEAQIPLLILDRPNPNGHYVDGPVLNLDFQSFVGMHPIPIVHGLTLAEMAQMILGEHWLGLDKSLELIVVPIQNYTHQTPYTLPIPPSPNLPNPHAIALYPSLCLLEPTAISVGRGTSMQFQIYGHPSFSSGNFSFTPEPNLGAKNPKLKGQECFGKDLRGASRPTQIELQWLIDAFRSYAGEAPFFHSGFERIAGVGSLKKQIQEGLSEAAIRQSWETELSKFKKMRKNYLIYPED